MTLILVIRCGYSAALSIWLLILKGSLKEFLVWQFLLPIPLKESLKGCSAAPWREFSTGIALSGRILRCAPGSDQLRFSQKASGLWATPCNSRITQKWQQLWPTQSTIWFPCEPFFGAISFGEYWIGLNTRIRSGKKLVNRSNNNGPDQIWPRFHEMSDWCGFCFEKGWTQTRVVTLKGIKQHVRM